MHLLQVLPVVAGLTAALPTEGIQARQTTVPTGVSVSGVSFSGAGCPAADLAGFAVPNAGTIPISRFIFKAATGVNNTRATETRLSCQSTINVSHPSGWQYALVKADFYGRVKLPQGAEATSKSTYSFAGDATSAAKSSQYYFDGPFDGLYFRNDRYTGTARTWSKCGTGAGLVINTEVRVAPIGNAVVNKEASMEAFVFHGNQLGIEWRKC